MLNAENILVTRIKIIVLSPYLPAVDTGACSRKIYDHINFLQKIGHFVYLLSFCSEEDKGRVNELKPYCKQLHLEYIKDYARYPNNPGFLKQKIDSLCKKEEIDILQCEKAYMARYIPGNIRIPTLLVEHEILSISFSERAKLEKNLLNKFILLLRKIKKRLEEKKWYKKFNKIIIFTEYDKDSIYKHYRIKDVEVIPLGVNLQQYSQQQKEEKPFDIIFVGNFSHLPNVDAAIYFCKNIFPLVKNQLPGASVIFAGANPPESIKKLAGLDKNIQVSGYIKDILGYYSKSRVFIAPIRFGTGMRFKILEALAIGLPVVTTSIGARGLIQNESIKVADREKEFADAVIQLLNNPNRCNSLARNGRAFLEKNYNWDMLFGKYEKIYSELLN